MKLSGKRLAFASGNVYIPAVSMVAFDYPALVEAKPGVIGETTMKPCLLLAAERSGTHLLRSLLEKVPGVRAPSEICNANSSGIRTDPASYLRFRELACLSNPDYFYPVSDVQSRLLDEYLAHLEATMAGAQLIVLDVKYSHVHNFNGCWWDFASAPFLLEYARKRNMPIIHLVREKVYRTAISNIYARESGVWSARRAEDVATITIDIPRRILERRVIRLVRTIDLFEEWLAACPHLRITYEELVTAGDEALGRTRRHLGLQENTPVAPAFVRTTPPYEAVVRNYDKLADLIDLDLKAIERSPRAIRSRRRRR